MMQETARLLKTYENIHILCHASPDGDTLGSGVALMLGLRQLGKRVVLCCGDPIPARYAFLLADIPQEDFSPETVISVDVADQKLLGSLQEAYTGKIDLAIDHHVSHVPFAKHTCLDSTCAATVEIIYLLLEELGTTINDKIATAIYTGLATDTGCFRFQNTTAQTHRIAAAVMDSGIPAGEINRELFDTKTKAQAAAEAAIIGSMEYHHNGTCALAVVSREMMAQTGLREEEQDALVGIPRQIEGVNIGITMKEKQEGGFKASFRTNPPMHAGEIAQRLGGGGHKGAAGCSVTLPLAEAKAKVLNAVDEYLRERQP